MVALLTCLAVSSNGQGEAPGEVSLDYVLDRYVEEMGGRAALDSIRSVRIKATLSYANDSSPSSLVVMKKRPNKVRMTLQAGHQRMVQAYDGETAWMLRDTGRSRSCVAMPEELGRKMIRNAPIGDPLADRENHDVQLQLGEDVMVVNQPCYQVIAQHPDGSTTAYYINKRTFQNHRILSYDANGKLEVEVIPSKFKSVRGVAFAFMTKQLVAGENASTITVEEVEINLGLVDTIFTPPGEFNPN